MLAIMCLALSSLALWSSAALLDDVARIKAAQAAHARALRSAELGERVVIRTKTAPGELDEFFDSSMRAIDQMAEKAQGMTSERARGQVADQVGLLLQSADAEVVVRQLNKSLDLRRKSVIDFAGGRARHEDVDLRPVDKLAAEHKLPVEPKLSLDQSSTLIQKQHESIQLLSDLDPLALLTSSRQYRDDMERLKFGLIPERMFASDIELSVEPGPDESSVRLVGRAAGADAPARFVAILDRDSSFLMRRFTEFDEAGETALDFVASDFRPAGSTSVPFRTEMTRPAMGIRDYHVEKRAVESVRLNIEVKEALFEIPADYRIQDFRRTRRVAGGRLKAQGTDLRQTSDAKNHQNQDKPQEGEQRSGDSSGGGAGRAGEIAIQKNPDKESKTRADGRKGVDDEDEWERFTREFIARFKLHDERGDAAWRILRDCQEQRSKYLGAQRERILRLQERLAVNKDDDADRLLLELESVLREFEDMKRPIDAIFEKQLKPRLDKLPTRAERAAVEASLRDP